MRPGFDDLPNQKERRYKAKSSQTVLLCCYSDPHSFPGPNIILNSQVGEILDQKKRERNAKIGCSSEYRLHRPFWIWLSKDDQRHHRCCAEPDPPLERYKRVVRPENADRHEGTEYHQPAVVSENLGPIDWSTSEYEPSDRNENAQQIPIDRASICNAKVSGRIRIDPFPYRSRRTIEDPNCGYPERSRNTTRLFTSPSKDDECEKRANQQCNCWRHDLARSTAYFFGD